jgi:molybdate transport system ATP-binding protein
VSSLAGTDQGLSVRLRQLAPIPLDVDFTCAARRVYTPPHRRSVGLVFQDYALFPHMSVRGQLLAAMTHVPAARRDGRLQELIALAHLDGLEDRKPAALSGGQQQRVAIARALARDPAVLLLDEPFASVDRGLRDALHREFLAVRRELRIPIVLVTHDFDDVVRLASDLIVLDHGRVAAAGTVAALTAANMLPGIWRWRDPAVALDAQVVAHDSLRSLSSVETDGLTLLVPSVAVQVGGRVRLQISAREIILASSRPEGLSLHNVVAANVIAV